MIFDSLGIGELGVVFALAVVLIKPKELGKLMREFGKFKRKVTQIQSDVKSQLEMLTLEAEAGDKREKIQHDKASMRTWAKEKLTGLPAGDRVEAAKALLTRITEWPSYKNAKVVSCFSSTLEEIDTEPLLRQILKDGKTLLLPYVTKEVTKDVVKDADAEGSPAILGMAVIADVDQDVAEGAYGILEPKPALRQGDVPDPDLVLVPGLCFDRRGGRLGKGMGFYDRYLTGKNTLRVGLGFDVQITEKNLTLDPHDQLMDAVISDKQIVVISQSRDFT